MPTVIGLSLGTQEVKSAVFKGQLRRLQVVSHHSRSLPPNDDRDAWLDSLGPALSSLGREIRQGSTPLVVALPAQLVFLRTLSVPFTRHAEIEQVLKGQIEAALPVSVEEVVVEYEIVRQNASSSDLFVAAIQKSDLRKLLSLLRGANLEPDAVTLDIFALTAFASRSDASVSLDHSLILDLGAGATKAVFLDQGQLVSARAFRVGGLALTKAIQQELGLSQEAAESMKVEATDLAEVSSEQLKKAINESHSRIGREVQMFIASIGEGGAVDRIILTGGGSRLKGVESLIIEGNVDVQQFGLPPSTQLPERLSSEPVEAANLLAVPLGSVLSRLSSGIRGHNLLREEFRPVPKLESFISAASAAFTLVFLLLGLYGYRVWLENSDYQKTLDGLQQRQQEVWFGVFGSSMPESAVLRRLDAKISKLEWQKKQIAADAPKRRSALRSLHALLSHIPAGRKFLLHSVNVSPSTINISGETDTLTSAQIIEQKISESPLLDCRLRNADTQDGKVRFQFEINLTRENQNGDRP